MIAPMVTWKPWKPVSMKKVEPYTPVWSVRFSSWNACTYSVAWQMRNATPRTIVAPSQPRSLPLLLAIRFQCANVTVTPALSSRIVLTAGSPQAAMGENCSTNAGPAEGQCGVKPGHTSAWLSSVARSGTDITRAQKSAPKNAPKNITSEKMKKLMPQRNETSSQRPYLPPSDSAITSPNQRTIM